MAKTVCFGEIMLRLSPPGYERFFQSPLLEAYISAAGKISRIALGDVTAPAQGSYSVPADYTQMHQVEGLPFGTRGGLLIRHQFPADGEYTVKILPLRGKSSLNASGSSVMSLFRRNVQS